MILLIDNYDSFVFNLARYVRELGCETLVVRNDDIPMDELATLRPEAAILSPGPCTPAEANGAVDFVRRSWRTLPMLGVCLGHQVLAAAFGGRIVRASTPVHGQSSLIVHDDSELFHGCDNPFPATRYHSLVVEETTLPAEFTIAARTDDGVPMAMRHRRRPLFGVQFHPESVLTEGGHRLLRNFLIAAGVDLGDDATVAAEERSAETHPSDPPLAEPLHW